MDDHLHQVFYWKNKERVNHHKILTEIRLCVKLPFGGSRLDKRSGIPYHF